MAAMTSRRERSPRRSSARAVSTPSRLERPCSSHQCARRSVRARREKLCVRPISSPPPGLSSRKSTTRALPMSRPRALARSALFGKNVGELRPIHRRGQFINLFRAHRIPDGAANSSIAHTKNVRSRCATVIAVLIAGRSRQSDVVWRERASRAEVREGNRGRLQARQAARHLHLEAMRRTEVH